ncbi:MAG TPA: hypothetical protein VF614_13440 [Chthoniobacteraceae bacterium]
MTSILIAGANAFAVSWEAAVAIRYLEGQGQEPWHRISFHERRKDRRPLSSPGEGHNSAPVFSPDGKTIIFQREMPGAEAPHLFQVGRKGKGAKPAQGKAPDW